MKKEKYPENFQITIDNEKITTEEFTYSKILKYLRERLKSDNPKVISSALLAIGKIGDSKSVHNALQLLNHSNFQVKKAAIEFLGWSKNASPVDSIGIILQKESHHHPVKHDLLNTLSLALKNINHPTCIPYLEDASKYGIQRAIESLGAIGDSNSPNVLIEGLIKSPKKCHYSVNALYWLVRRSNLDVKDWMKPPNPDHMKLQMDRIPLWIDWWTNNQDKFEVIKSKKEVLKNK